MKDNVKTQLPSPLVDLEALCLRLDASDADYERVGKEIVKAFDEAGFVYVTNHGVQKEKIDTYVKEFDKFFDLDRNTKMKYERSRETLHGYMSEMEEGFEYNTEVISPRDCYDFQNFEEELPTEVPGLEEAISGVLDKSVPMVEKVMRAIGAGLGVPYEVFGKCHTDSMTPQNFTNLRVLRYAPVPKHFRAKLRFEEHIDEGVTVTFQFHADREGLQVKDRDGNWRNSKICPDAFLLFPSRTLEKWTSDRILGTPHRVTLPKSDEDLEKPRHCVIFFITPKKSAVVKCLHGINKYPPRTFKEEMNEASAIFYRKAK